MSSEPFSEFDPPQSPAPAASPQPASARPGMHAPLVHGKGEDWARIASGALTTMEGVEEARQLFRIAKNRTRAINDAAYPHLKPYLLRAESSLQRALRDDPADPGIAVLLQEVRSMIPGRRVD